MSSTVLMLLLPIDSIHSRQVGANLLVGVSLSISTLKVRKHVRNFFLSPIRTTLEMHGKADLMLSSIGTGATFSPPAVMMSSFFRPAIHITLYFGNSKQWCILNEYL